MPDKSKVTDWWTSRLKMQGVEDSNITAILNWVMRDNNTANLYTALRTVIDANLSKEASRAKEHVKKEKQKGAITDVEALSREKEIMKDLEAKMADPMRILEVIQKYVRCISPDAVVDLAHFTNRCSLCGTMHDFYYKDMPEYNQICVNCAGRLPPYFFVVCPCCNSGLPRTIQATVQYMKSHETSLDLKDVMLELMPRVIGTYEDVDHFPAFPLQDKAAQDYKDWNNPDYRYVLQCPICLWKWAVVLWIPDEFAGDSSVHLCPVCGSPTRPTGRTGKGGCPIYQCTSKSCNKGLVDPIVGEVK